jgi:hypothetical protein
VVVVNVTTSHNVPTDTSEWECKSGTMCALRAARGNIGMGSSASCVDRMSEPFGLRMVMGCSLLFVYRRQVHG